MLDVGLGVIVAAAPAPPVPAPPGKPSLPLSSLRCRSSSWWFSNGSTHGRDTTTSRRATRRRWWSDPDGSRQQDYRSYSLEDDYDYEDDQAAFSGFGWAGDLFDESWFSKVFKTYGVILPVMLTSMFAATELKAFLMAMAIPLSQSAISFLLRRKGNRDDSWSIWKKKRRRRRPLFQEEEEDYPEYATDFAAGGRGNGYSSSNNHHHQPWVSKDFADGASTAVGADDYTKSSNSGDGWGGNKSGGAYGGWDELLDNNTVAAQGAKRSSNSFSARNTDYSTKSWPPERMRRRRKPRTMGLGSTRYKQAPPLMSLLVAVFPFLRSWFRLL